MAVQFTLEDFNKKLLETGLQGQFSDADLKLAQQNPSAGLGLINAKLEYSSATTEEAKSAAHQKAEELRKSYGNYTAGTSGGGYIPGTQSAGTFEYDSYSYDPQTDALYQAYKKQYTREGRRASEDTLGNVASMTGGMPSSYAVSAAAQSGNRYAAALTDKIPELEKQAYSRYTSDRDFAYKQYTDEYKSQQSEYSQKFNEAMTAAEYGDYSYLNSFGINTDNYIKEREFEQTRQKFENLLSQQEYEKLQDSLKLDLSYAELAAKVNDYDTLNHLTGITADNSTDRNELLYKIAAQLAKAGDYSLLYSLMRSV